MKGYGKMLSPDRVTIVIIILLGISLAISYIIGLAIEDVRAHHDTEI